MKQVNDNDARTTALETVKRTFDGYNGNAIAHVGAACVKQRLNGMIVVRKSGALPVAIGFYKNKNNPFELAQVRVLPGDTILEFDGQHLTDKIDNVTMLRVIEITPNNATSVAMCVKVRNAREKVEALKRLPLETRLALTDPKGRRGRPFVAGPLPRISRG